MDATEQHQTLRALWPRWRAIATSTSEANDRARAEQAVHRLYRLYELNEPATCWIDSIHRLPLEYIGTPVLPHLRDSLIYAVWHRLNEPAWVLGQIGYNIHAGSFRLPLNLQLLTSRTNITPRRIRRRPAWLTNANNMISQFDVDALAVHDLARQTGIHQDSRLQELADAVREIIESCFAAILFEESCLLVMKPHCVTLNEFQQLSAQGKAAFESFRPAGRKVGYEPFHLYAMNGRLLSINEPPNLDYHTLSWRSPTLRVALIEYMGWEAFFDLMMRHQNVALINKDRYGVLYRIDCGTQEFVVVKVKNSTAEPDGRYRHYVIPVDPQLRPLPDPHNPRERLGPPQAATALNAVASTFGMTGDHYASLLGKES